MSKEKPAHVWTYWLPSEKGEGYAWIVLDSEGRFMTISDWGNYAYWWSPNSTDTSDFRHWVRDHLCGPYFDYLVGKLGMDRGRVLKVEESVKRIKDEVCKTRRTGGLTKEEARDEWDLIDGAHDEGALYNWHTETKLQDAFELPVHDYPTQLYCFAEKVMPRLKALLDAELASAQPPVLG